MNEHPLEALVLVGLTVLNLPMLFRLWRGPTLGDRMLALEVIGSLGVLALLALTVISERAIYLDLAVLLVLFSFLGTLVMARYMERGLI